MFTLIKNIQVYSPENIGEKDVLICNDKIIEICDNISYALKDLKIIDGTGKRLIPGIMDQHIHIIGGGGEGSFKTRVPEVNLSDLIKGGITTVVGLLGTDCLTRSVENLVAKTKALKEEGINAYCLTGGYEFPSPSLTGNVKKDIVFIDEIIGIKLALSDHRSSVITNDELARLASEARVGGMLSGKPGYVTLHMGNGIRSIKPIFEVLQDTDIPINHFRPTHVGRKKELFYDSIEFNKMGGYIDITASDRGNIMKVTELFKILKENNGDLSKVTLTSDGNGSWSNYDSSGKMTEIGAAKCDVVLKRILELAKEDIFSLDEAIRFGTSNVADALGISDKRGYIKEEYFADLIILDEHLELDSVISNGILMMENKEILVKGTYEN
ncbi:beta-aspartyl-peptidase [Fusobacterium sp. MFO224]|uniref:beta-aspartyl-peptidase n=1 Tax=Fusobacterium sp. MFO224 TaxID=3378070 RepID=UPI003851C047